MKKHNAGVAAAIRTAAGTHKILSIGTLLCAVCSVLASLLPPLLLGHIIDDLTSGMPLLFSAILLYFGSLALEGILSAGQETLLEMFGQKMTHALRSEMSAKLTLLPASTLAGQEPGAVAARFSGDVDTVEALFTSGVISMAADACRILSILAVIAVENLGLAHSDPSAAAAGSVHPARAEADAGSPAGKSPSCGSHLRSGAGSAAQHPHHPRPRVGALHGKAL